MKLLRPLSPERLALYVAMALVLLFNLPFWQRLWEIVSPLDGHGVKMLALALALTTTFFYWVLLLFVWPRVGKPLIGLLLLTTAAVSYFMNQYGVLIDQDMVRNALQTDGAEVRDLLTVKMALTVLLLGVLPCWLLWKLPVEYRPGWRRLGRRLAHLGIATLALAAIAAVGYQDFASLFRNHRELRMALAPLNYLQASTSYLRKVTAKPQPLQQIGLDARQTAAAHDKPRVLVLVVGETARADHFALNGYPRPTTPELAARTDIVNYPNAWSCGTETAVSVPCMFSAKAREQFDTDRARHEENLLDVLKRAGLTVLWVDNNSGCKEVCNRVEKQMRYDEQHAKYCRDGECFDEILLDGLPERLAALKGDAVIVLHQKGSHGPAYYKRYPPAFERFKPVCRTSELQQCAREDIINAFDNTIAYTDFFLAQTIRLLEKQANIDSSLLYLSDHGESLGENGMYLHATPYLVAPDAQKHIPMVAWFSPGWREHGGPALNCLKTQAGQRYSQDNLFHSVLGMMGVSTALYQRELDMFAGCRQAS